MEIVQYRPASSPLKEAIKKVKGEAFILFTKPVEIDTEWERMVQRMETAAQSFKSAIVYSDYNSSDENGNLSPHPLIDYQTGSLRDDFDFGPVIYCRTSMAKKCLEEMQEEYRYAAIYELRLRMSLYGDISHIPETLYTAKAFTGKQECENQFEYVNPLNREVQIEMEKVCTRYLKDINAIRKPPFRCIDPYSETFENEASVIIPVYNRARTIADAVRSALAQACPFRYNVIVVDNHSTDGTGDIISRISKNNPQVVHLVPERKDLGIGGCWDFAVHNRKCGKFAVQLDSDDLYSDKQVLEKIVAKFYQEKCGMVIGSYRLVNFALEELPPGIIDHREWTGINGMNNALRINGFGAPRAFYTPLARNIGFPNVSYGEDYAIGLAISRNYKIGRIFSPLYLCRRWEGNSDNRLTIEKQNRYNHYKDWIRSMELLQRIEK